METLRAVKTLKNALPDSWAIELDGNDYPDLTIRNEDGGSFSFSVYSNRAGALPVSELLAVLEQMRQRTGQPVVYLSDYIGPTARSTLTNAQFSFADETGWLYLRNDNPMLLLSLEGAPKAPATAMRGQSRMVRLNGKGANRLICALALASPPFGVRELARIAGVSPGTATKILTALVSEGIVERNDAKQITKIQRRALIERWVQDYQFTTANQPVRYFIAPRGVSKTVEQLRTFDQIAFTGSVAARELLPKGISSPVPLSLVAMYAANPDEIGSELQLIPADSKTYNVVIASPQRPEILSSEKGIIPLTPTPLILADLFTLPNRGDSEVNQLMNIFAESDQTWSDNDN